MSNPSDLMAREQVLRGLPAKRASTLLFAVESQTAHLLLRERQEATLYLTQAAAEAGEHAFLRALAEGRALPIQPKIQDLEHYAPQWAALVPADANSRAAIARLLGDKYLFTYEAVPALRRALGLDEPAVQQAYQRLYGQPLATIYATTITWQDHLRWAWARVNRRLENLPPFWIAFVLTMPGAPGLLALPIALARIGPAAGIVVVILFGLINMLTVAALAETVARSGTTRFGLGFLGQLVQEYLGRAGSLLLTAVLAINNFLVLIIFYLGVGGTLENSTGLPAFLWNAALFAVCIYFLFRGSLNSTVTVALLIVLVSTLAILVIPLLALPHVQISNLTDLRLPSAQGQPFDPAALGLVVGVMLTTFFSHFLVASYGPVVLRRDPSARSWIGGSVAAVFVFMLIALLWMVAVNGAIPPEVLAATTGTVLTPLAKMVGPGIQWLGSLLVILSLGLATIQVSLGLYYLIQERFPAQSARARNDRSRFLISISPAIAVFLLSEWLTLTGAGSFAILLGTVNAISLPLLGGVFPVLLLAATRRKGDFVPGVAFGWLGHPAILAGTFLFFWGSILVHGLFIWQEPLLRAFALFTGLIVLGVTIVILRRGALDPRVVIELRQDRRLGGRDEFNVTANGKPAAAAVQLEYPGEVQRLNAFNGAVPAFATLRAVTFQVPAAKASQLKIWAHQITPEGNSEGLPVIVEAESGAARKQFNLKSSDGLAVLPINDTACQVRITFP